ncbi:hypothetical protein FRC09_018038, partial [Ceratobasidium sp. 395]
NPPLPALLTRERGLRGVTRTVVQQVEGEPAPFADELGPEHDLDLFAGKFPTIMLRGLIGDRATKAAVESEIRWMFKKAAFLKAIILYFAGHGNDQNALVLNDGRSVSQRAVFNWVDERPKIAGRGIPVFIVFDFCQPYRFPTPLPSHKLTDVCVIWGCRRGETSQDMNLGDDVPYSDLLKSICLALYEAEPCPLGSFGEFMRRVATHVSCLMKVHRAG